ncbi:hypothetical protein HLB44_05530 [Aquincola sp. S2]|uniref:Tetratricopeptide repeat protein n=1 Tax=Pseudaquabacterium terrae TaxID=2732868 RepID=A0ABX2ECS7_9BURK|nr:hypothetical protein [Aquabacterium terrae]NRF66438.1 hypothetical protein [Aquabacterium terrae]
MRIWCTVTALLAVLLAACGSAPPAPPAAAGAPAPTAAPAPATTGGVEAFERRQRAKADVAARQGRLGEAVLAWEALVALRPEQRDYRERLAAMRALVQSTLAERLPKADAAARRGDSDGATQLYLSVLVIDPQHEGAADALRQLERDRNKRQPPGARFAREASARRTAADAAARPPTSKPVPASAARADADRNAVEHASMLAGQGELDDAIALLQAPAAGQRSDTPAARKLLAELLVQKAERIATTDRPGAIAALERSLQLDAAQPTVRQRLQLLREGGTLPAPAVPLRKPLPFTSPS